MEICMAVQLAGSVKEDLLSLSISRDHAEVIKTHQFLIYIFPSFKKNKAESGASCLKDNLEQPVVMQTLTSDYTLIKT